MDGVQPVRLWPIKQRRSLCLWRARQIPLHRRANVNRRRTPEITRWRRTKYAIKVMVIRADRKPICSLGSGSHRRKCHFSLLPLPPSPPSPSLLSPRLLAHFPHRFTAILGVAPPSLPLLPHPRTRAVTLRSFRVLEKGNRKKKGEKKREKKRRKIKQQKRVRRGLSGPTDRRERERDSCRWKGAGEKSDHWCGAQITERRGRNN